MLISDIPRECNSYVLLGGRGEAPRLEIFSKMQESWSKVGHVPREIVTVVPVILFLVTVVSQMVKPPNESVSAHLGSVVP